MQRFLSKRSSIAEAPAPEKVASDAGHDADQSTSDSTTALINPNASLPPLNLKIKRVDYYYSSWSKVWKYRNTSSKITPEMLRPAATASDGSDPWQSYCFVVVRTLPEGQDGTDPTFKVVVKSPYLRQACKEVVQEVQGVSWTAEPLELEPELLIAFYPHFQKYGETLRAKRGRSQEESNILSSVQALTDYLRKDYRGTLASIANYTEHGEITFELLYAILVPRTVLLADCPATSEPRALRLKSISKICGIGMALYELVCESVDAFDSGFIPNNSDVHVHHANGTDFGITENKILIPQFKGAIKIASLNAFPLQFHPDEQKIRSVLIARGKKWYSLMGMHHMYYKATATAIDYSGPCPKIVRYNVDSRIMIDRATFKQINPNYALPVTRLDTLPSVPQTPEDWSAPLPVIIPTLQTKTKVEVTQREITDEDLLLAPAIVYGFSLTDKLWLEFNVVHVLPIVWNTEAFANLVLPDNRKVLLQSLVEAHDAELGFDDFVQGKGHGLVINLYGPPGVGKTLSAEATSEHVKRPLYIIGGGDLGTNALNVDQELKTVFDIATNWKAIVLVDEADVFLEARSLDDLERNAMVAVFLRHIEYYRGILFLTTNRIKTFDPAFLSRIHVALHFQDLPKSARAQVWRAFLLKVGLQPHELTDDLLDGLAEWNVNGREIKNATRTAHSLAVSRGERLGLAHLTQTLTVMEEFAADFAALKSD